MSNDELKKEEVTEEIVEDGDTLKGEEKPKRKKSKRRSRRVHRQKQIVGILVVLISGVLIFQIQEALGNQKNHVDDTVYTGLRFDMPIKQTLEIITIENKGNEKLFTNQNNKIEYSDIKNYVEDNLDRYVAYHALHPEYLESEVIWKVNANFDYDPYTNILMIEDGNNVLSVVNKNRALYDGFVPQDLVEIEGIKTKEMFVTRETNEQFVLLLSALKKADLTIDVVNAYESYADIMATYNQFKDEDEESVDQKAVRPGHSEHQLGLSIDVSDGTDTRFQETDTYHWLKSNAHRFGFIFRYDRPEENTGYPQEANHLRFVGKETAIDMYEKNIGVLEEYLDKHGD